MYKASIELGRVHKTMKLSFNLIIDGDSLEEIKQPYARNMEPLYKRFHFNGNDYFRVHPRPFITIDISDRKEKRKEGWNPGYSVALNQRALFALKTRLRKIIHVFHTERNLFYYNERGELTVHQKLAHDSRIFVPTNQKVILIQPCVVQDDERPDTVYEGVFFAINRMEYYTYLTFEELEYFYDMVSSINMIELSMHLLELARLHQDDSTIENEEKNPATVEWEEFREDDVLNQPTVYKKEPPTIPDI